MKPTKIFLLILSILAVSFLAGCDDGEEKTPVTPEDQAVKEISEADQIAYDGAISTKDATICEKITNQEYRDECKTVLEENQKRQSAIESQNIALCEELKKQEDIDACKMEIEINKIIAENKKTQKQIRDNSLLFVEEIIVSGDISKCNNIEVEDIRKECEFTIAINEIKKTKDTSVCSEIQDEAIRQVCINNADRILALDDEGTDLTAPPLM
jgi:hypothetical protein